MIVNALDQSGIHRKPACISGFLLDFQQHLFQIGIDRYHSDNIVIRLDSYDNRLKQTNPVTVTLQARQSSTVSIPVEARGSGNIQTFIRILDSSGNEIGSAQTLEIRVRADWENLGTVIIAGFFGAILLFGVVKSLRRGKQHAPVDPAEFAKADRERRGGAPTPQKDDSDAVE